MKRHQAPVGFAAQPEPVDVACFMSTFPRNRDQGYGQALMDRKFHEITAFRIGQLPWVILQDHTLRRLYFHALLGELTLRFSQKSGVLNHTTRQWS